MIIRTLHLLLLCAITVTPAQTILHGALIAHVDSVIAGMPARVSGGEYVSPNSTARVIWKSMFTDLLAAQYATAQEKAGQLGYQIVCLIDSSDGKSYYIAQRQRENGSPHWGLFVVNPQPLRPTLIIQSPHPKYDLNTGRQGVRVYQRTGAKVFFLSGAHRCNSPEHSGCDGTTSVCGTSEKHRLSDQPHTIEGTFQVTTELLETTYKDLIYVQLHGFAQRQGDPDIIMSNTHNGTPPVDNLVTLREALRLVDPALTYKIVHLDNWSYLAGTTNMQGRLVNGIVNPCYVSAKKNSGRFLHLEQSYNKLRDSEQNWDKMAQALMIAFPAQPASVPAGGARLPLAFDLLQNYPNPFNQETFICYRLQKDASCEVSIHDILGRRIKVLASGRQAAGLNRLRWDGTNERGENQSSGVYFYRLRVAEQAGQGKMLLVR